MKHGIISACMVGAMALALCLSGIALAQPVVVPPVQPPAGPTLMAVLSADAQFSTFVGLVKASGMEKTLESVPSATVFAPTNAAFAAMPKEEMETLEKDTMKAKAVVMDHLADMGAFKAADLAKVKGVHTFSNKELVVVAKDNVLETVGGAKIVTADIVAGNGLIQALDKVTVATPIPEPPKPTLKTEGETEAAPKTATDTAK
jgi:uncharacterized surface protein with fasciclin (FAS1) repeats